MAKIIENHKGRKTIELNVDEVINIVREYQNMTHNCSNYKEIRENLNKTQFYLPEDV
jgi:hypothetical protein